MALQRGSIYLPSGADELRDDFLTDVRLESIAAGVSDPPVYPKSDWWILGTALANINLIHYSNFAASQKRTSVLEATGDDLEEIRVGSGLPEVKPSGSSGKVVVSVTSGSATITQGQAIVLPNGLRAEASSTTIGVVDQGEIDVKAIDTGSATNFPGGTPVRFLTPPVNVKTDAKVSTAKPLTGGTDTETDDRKRDRILNRLRNLPAGGNWAYVRETILNEVPAVNDVFVYPALGGPGSVKVICLKPTDPDNSDWSRTPSASTLADARAALYAKMPSDSEIVVQGPVDTDLTHTVTVTIPDSATAGGDGRGWVDAAPWPDLVGADGGRVTVSSVTNSTNITVAANTTTSPTAGVTHIAWWSPQDRKFRKYLVTAASGTTGAWVITLDRPLVDSTATIVAAGDYISPDAVSIEEYGKTWAKVAATLGPTEQTANAYILPRAQRHPKIVDEKPAQPSIKHLTQLVAAHPEMTDIDYGYTTTLTLPASLSANPKTYALKHFGVYAI